jgi:hypothetical protein
MMKKPRTTWNVPVSELFNEMLKKALEHDTHATKADFIRDAVRRRLEAMGIKAQPTKEVPSQ